MVQRPQIGFCVGVQLVDSPAKATFCVSLLSVKWGQVSNSCLSNSANMVFLPARRKKSIRDRVVCRQAGEKGLLTFRGTNNSQKVLFYHPKGHGDFDTLIADNAHHSKTNVLILILSLPWPGCRRSKRNRPTCYWWNSSKRTSPFELCFETSRENISAFTTGSLILVCSKKKEQYALIPIAGSYSSSWFSTPLL